MFYINRRLMEQSLVHSVSTSAVQVTVSHTHFTLSLCEDVGLIPGKVTIQSSSGQLLGYNRSTSCLSLISD